MPSGMSEQSLPVHLPMDTSATAIGSDDWPAKWPMSASPSPVPRTDLKHFNLECLLGRPWLPGS